MQLPKNLKTNLILIAIFFAIVFAFHNKEMVHFKSFILKSQEKKTNYFEIILLNFFKSSHT